MANTLEKLKQWQAAQARRECVEGYRVLPYKTLVELAHVCPRNEMELLQVRGIGAVKARRYGAALLAIVNSADAHSSTARRMHGDDTAASSGVYDARTGEVLQEESADVFAVSDFLRALNVLLSSHFAQVRVRGEVVDFRRNTSGHAYFQIKDAQGVMRVTVFRGAFERSGVTLEDGMEIIVTGRPQHHAQYGFSFIGETLELAGEGALKKAYDALKKKLTQEGMLDAARKRSVPDFAQRIGVITSRGSAAIGDFMSNLAPHGCRVLLAHSAVEGQRAVHELLRALRAMRAAAQCGAIEVLVVTRGGGSLESLQAFNNEAFVRALADFPVPVIAGIGHERDETLATLVADIGVSTPTAAARVLNESWTAAAARVERATRVILDAYGTCLAQAMRRVERSAARTVAYAEAIFAIPERARMAACAFAALVEQVLRSRREALVHGAQTILWQQRRQQRAVRDYLVAAQKLLAAYDPHTLLTRGYAIVRSGGRLVRRVTDVRTGGELNIRMSDGTIEATVIRVTRSAHRHGKTTEKQ